MAHQDVSYFNRFDVLILLLYGILVTIRGMSMTDVVVMVTGSGA